MRGLVLCALVALTTFIAFSHQASTVSDVRQIGATSTFYTEYSTQVRIQTQTDGSKYVIGAFKGTFTVAGTTYTGATTTFDMYIIKYNPDGSVGFVKIIPVHTPSASSNYAKGAVAADGSIYLSAINTPTFVVDGTTISAASGGVLLKLNAAGTLVWFKTVTGVSIAGVRAMSDNGCMVMTYGSATAVWSDGTSTAVLNTLNVESTYYRFTAAGTKTWENRRMQVAKPGAYNPYFQFVSRFNDAIYSSSQRKETSSVGSVIEKISSTNGALLWTIKALSSTTGANVVDQAGVSVDANENVYVAGYYKTGLTLISSDGSQKTLAGSNAFNIAYVAKFDSNGINVWLKQIKGTTEAFAGRVAYNTNGVLAVVGYHSSAIAYDGVNVLNKVGGATNDAYILLVDSVTGNLNQAQTLSSAAADTAMAVTVSGNGFDVMTILGGTTSIAAGVAATSQTIAPISTPAAALIHFEDLTCNNFDTVKFGSKKPVVTATANGQTITVSVTMYRQSSDNLGTPVWFNLDSKDLNSDVCRPTGDAIIASATVPWVITTDGCSTTYTLTQTLTQIVNTGLTNNNWVATLAGDGRSIAYTLPVYATYSVHPGTDCYFAGYRSVVTFRTVLSIASSTNSFVTADASAKFVFSGLRITSSNTIEVQGTIIPMIQNLELRAISLSKASGPSFTTATTSCSVYSTGCAQVYSANVADFGGAGTDISGAYNTYMDIYENGVLTRSQEVITYTLTYVIPANPNVVDGDTIATASTLYTDSNYNVVRTQSYSTATGALFVENAITLSSPVIPSTYRLRMDRGYLCCVNYLTQITAYNPTTDTGGCRDTAGKVEWVDLGSEASHANGITEISADATNYKRYRVQVGLSQVFASQTHATPLSCEILLISKLVDAGARRGNALEDSTFVSTATLLVEADGTVYSSASKINVVYGFALVAAIVALLF